MEQKESTPLVRRFGGVAFVATNCMDVVRELAKVAGRGNCLEGAIA